MYTYTVKKSDWLETGLYRAFSGSHKNKVTFFQYPTMLTDTGRDPQYNAGRICMGPESGGVRVLPGLYSEAPASVSPFGWMQEKSH